jgi:hypothetical protein
MFGKPLAHLLQHVDNGRLVVIARNADNYIRRFDLFDPLRQIWSKRSIVFHDYSPADFRRVTKDS